MDIVRFGENLNMLGRNRIRPNNDGINNSALLKSPEERIQSFSKRLTHASVSEIISSGFKEFRRKNAIKT